MIFPRISAFTLPQTSRGDAAELACFGQLSCVYVAAVRMTVCSDRKSMEDTDEIHLPYVSHFARETCRGALTILFVYQTTNALFYVKAGFGIDTQKGRFTCIRKNMM